MFIVFLFQIVQSFDAEKLLTNEKFKQITRVTWLRDDSYLTFSEKTEIQIKLPPFYNLSTIIPTLDDCFYSKSSLSPSLRLLAIPCEFSSIFRVSYTAKFAFYDLFTQKYIEIKMPKGQSYRFQHFKWIGRHESFIFIKDNNIFYANSFDKYPEQLTFDGEPNRIFNGVPDWVYEEEIYMQRDTVLADPNGEKIIFIKIDDSEIKGTLVPEFDKSQPYDQVFQTVEYPKAGQKIPRVNLMLLYLKAKRKSVKRQAIELLPPHRFRGSGKILSFFSFVISDEIVACWMNRLQDEIYMMKYKLKSVGSKMILREEIIFKASVQSWIEDKTFGDVHYSAKFDHLFFLWPFEQVDGDKYMHIMALDWSNPTEFLGITSGKWEVYNIICLNENYIYYISNEQGVGTRHLYALNLESNVQKCLTCDFPKDECDVVDVKTNNNCNKAHIICQAQDVSFSFIRIFEKDDKFGYKDIDLNDKTVPTPENPTLFKNRLFTLRYENGSPVDVYEQIPILNQSDDVKTDFLINIYGGPSSNHILLSGRTDYAHYLAFVHGLTLLQVDTRGSYGRGLKHRSIVKHKLGQYEAEDVRAVILYYKELNPKANFIVIGWSYGGYLTLTCIKDYPDIISNGVAIAPVVDWRFYDSFYTERYMGLPTSKDNLEGYEITSLLNNTTSFKNAQLFLIHGTSDDNVHFENSAKFVDKLTQAGIFTRFRVFPFKNHGISGQEERKLLVKEIGQFISDLKEIWHKNRDLTTQQSVQ